jgi:exosome complex RNA-binding protein Rrp4
MRNTIHRVKSKIVYFYTALLLSLIVRLAKQVNIIAADNGAIWDDAQNVMEKVCLSNPNEVDELKVVFKTLTSRARERAEDIRTERVEETRKNIVERQKQLSGTT